MIAALPMYDRPESVSANDAFWTAIHAELGYGPKALTRGADVWGIWQSPDLLLAQTCGLPFRARLYEHVTLVGTPDYGLPGCAPGDYNSVLVVHAHNSALDINALNGKTLAYNEPLSQSGWAAPLGYATAKDVAFGGFVQTGGHQASALAVAEGKADIAAIDAQTWELIRRYDRYSDNLREIARTPPTPALPFITAASRDPAPLRAAIGRAIATLDTQSKTTLGLCGIVDIPAETYLAQPIPAPPPS